MFLLRHYYKSIWQYSTSIQFSTQMSVTPIVLKMFVKPNTVDKTLISHI